MRSSPLPADVGQAIRTVKAQLRGQIGDVAAVFAGAEEAMRAEATAVAADREAGRPVWPVVQFRDIAAGTVPAGAVEAIRRRGCVVVQDTFPASAPRTGMRSLPVTPNGTVLRKYTAPLTTGSSPDASS